jgi:DNA repair protein RadD
LHLFKNVKLILIDECDLVNAKGGMYEKLISSLPDAKVLGLTATPYRLTSGFDGAMLKFINRTNPRIFNKCIYYIQNSTLFDAGHLAKLEYFDKTVIDRTMLQMNTSGTDFTEASMKAYYRSIESVVG